MSHAFGITVLGADDVVLPDSPPSAAEEQAFRLNLSILEHRRAQVAQGGLAEAAGIVSFGTLDAFLAEMRQLWPTLKNSWERKGVLERMANARVQFDRAYLDSDGYILPKFRIGQNPIKVTTAAASATSKGIVQAATDLAKGGAEAAQNLLPWYAWVILGVGAVGIGAAAIVPGFTMRSMLKGKR